MEHPFGREPDEGASRNQCLDESARRTSIALAIENFKSCAKCQKIANGSTTMKSEHGCP